MGKKSDALFVAFKDMRAVTLFLSNETADVSIGGDCTGSYTPIKPHRVSQASDSRSKPYLHREKNIRYGTRIINNLLQYYELRGKQSFVSYFSRLLRTPQRMAKVLFCTLKKPVAPRG